METPKIEQLQKLFFQLKDEISKVDQRNSQFLTLSVTASGTILALGFSQGNPERSWIFLCTYVFLFPTYSILYGNRRHGWRISTYIRVFIEPYLPGIRWESRLTELRRSAKGEIINRLSSGITLNEFKLVSGMSFIVLIALLVNLLQIVFSNATAAEEIPLAVKMVEKFELINGIITSIFGILLFTLFYVRSKNISHAIQRNGLIEQEFFDSWMRIKEKEEYTSEESESRLP